MENSEANRPTAIRRFSSEEIQHLGIHTESGALYWHNLELMTKRRLASFERVLAGFFAFGTFLGALATVGLFLVEVGFVDRLP